MSNFNPDPGVSDAEETDFVARLEDRYSHADMTGTDSPARPWRHTPTDQLGYGRWTNSYLVKRQTGIPHEEATQAVLAEIQALVHPEAPPAESGVPFVPASRTWKGNMCGIRIPGLPAVPGGAKDPSLFLSWFYHLYSAEDRTKIRSAMLQKGYTHWLMSWPDAQDVGFSPQQFKDVCAELASAGFQVCVMLSAKPTSSANTRSVQGTLANIMLVLPMLVGLVPMFCIGWELSLWLSPTDVRYLIDHCAPIWLQQPRTLGYVHFQEGYFSFSVEVGGKSVTADFWKANVGKLHGVLHQRDLSWDKPMYQARIVDCLQRFAGGFGFPKDSGFGMPFDFIAFEITAMPTFNGQMTEAEGNAWGQTAIQTPPSGAVKVMGSGNGQ